MAKQKHKFLFGRVEEQGKHLGVIWDSAADMAREAARVNRTFPNEERTSRREHKRADTDTPWGGTYTFGEALDMAEHGWPEGRERAEGLAELMEGQIGVALQPTFDRVFDVQGVEPDVPMYLAGEPECMVDYHLVDRKRAGRVVKVFVDFGGSGGYGVNVFLARAAAVMALCESIHRQGDTVEVWAGHYVSGRGTGETLFTSCCVQKAGDIYDPDALAFFCGHPAMLRRIGFGVEELCSDEKREALDITKNGGYGTPAMDIDTTKKELARYIESITGEFDVVIGSLNSGSGAGARVDWEEESSRVDWIKGQMEAVGFTIEKHETEGVV
jgi:hypothetical protein